MHNRQYRKRKYEVKPYDGNWVKQFDAEATRVKAIFGNDAISIQHIGSTAVHGLDGQPTIDMLLLVEDITIADEHIKPMELIGYKYFVDYVSPNSRLFAKENENRRIFNVHIFPKDHPHVSEMIKLRDYLRKHPKEIQKYGEFKRKLSAQYPEDYAKYRKFKDKYVRELQTRVLISKRIF